MQLMFVKLIFNLLLLYEMCIIHKSENFSAILVFFIFSVIFSSIIAITIPDTAGQLSRVIEILGGQNVNIEYLYAFIGKSDKAVSNYTEKKVCRQSMFMD